MPKYTISVLCWDRLEYTRSCVAALVNGGRGEDWECIITDNGSVDGTPKYLAELCEKDGRFRVIRNARNLGFIEPNRRALAEARGEYFVLLNNDARVSAGWLGRMVAPFEADRWVGLSGPGGRCFTSGLHGGLGPYVEYLEGSCMMGRVGVLREVGLFAPYLQFAYGEDADLCLRMRRLGWKLAVVGMEFDHSGSVTSSRVEGILRIEEMNHAEMRKRWDFYLRHPGRPGMEWPVVLKRVYAMGDVLLAGAVIEGLRRERPVHPVYVETNYPELFRGNPDVVMACAAVPDEIRSGAEVIELKYEDTVETHIVDAYARCVGLEKWERKISFRPTVAERAWAEGFVGGEKWVAVHPGPTTWQGKNWPWKRWNELVMLLGEAGWKTVAVGWKDGEMPVVDLDLRGKTSVGQLGAVLGRCRGLVTVDSFPLHMAQAVGCPVVGLFGVTSPEYICTEGSRWVGLKGKGPMAGERHKRKNVLKVESDGAEMRSISVDEVLGAVEELLT